MGQLPENTLFLNGRAGAGKAGQLRLVRKFRGLHSQFQRRQRYEHDLPVTGRLHGKGDGKDGWDGDRIRQGRCQRERRAGGRPAGLPGQAGLEARLGIASGRMDSL